MPIDLGSNSLINTSAPTLKKPPHLLTLDDGLLGKVRQFQRFIAMDKPEVTNGLMLVKGFFSDQTEDEIHGSIHELLSTTPKETIKEMMFPLHRIYHIRNLTFNAVKTITGISQERR